MEITSPSGKTYVWNKATPPTEADIAELQRYEEQQEAVSGDMKALRQRWNTATNPAEKAVVMTEGIGKKALEMVQSMGLRGAPPAVGQVLGQRFAGPVGKVAGGAIGGAVGSVADQARLMHTGQQQGFSMGQLAGDTFAGAVPARGNLANVATNLGAANLESFIDTGKPADMQRNMMAASGALAGATASRAMTGQSLTPYEKLYEDRLRAFRELRKEGVVVAPHEIDRGSMMMASIGGKAAMGQEASKRNQYVWQKLGREDLGLSKEARPFRPTRVTESGKVIPGELDEVIKSAYEPYETIRSISENAKKEADKIVRAPTGHELAVQMDTPEARKLLLEAGADVEALKLARHTEKEAFKRLKSNEPGAYEKWQEAKMAVRSLDDRITAAAESVGDPKLVQRLAESRQRIAMAYAYMNATDKTTGLVDPKFLADQLNSDVPLTGNARKIADFHNAFSRNAVEGVKAPSPDVDGMTTGLASVSAAQGNPAGFMASGFPLARGPARASLLNRYAQDRFARPRFQPNAEDFAAAIARYSGQTAGRQGEPPTDTTFLRYMTTMSSPTFNR